MSESIRQSNLFAAEDYKKVFKAYQFIDYTAYDYDTLKQALLNYIQTYYPEDFNDYIESSEFIAIVELLAYFGTSLAFRTDLNSRENFIDTAERRESVIRLAQMVNYVPRRNVAASGLFKISAVQTNQPLTDSNGLEINDTTIFWNDANNDNWFDQFVQICNAAFSSLNPFGRPTKSGSIGGIPTDLYELNNVLNLAVTYPVNININGQTYPVDICNPDFVTNETIFERHPDPADSFNFIYRNDSLGVSSENTGFFLYFKQGNLMNVDSSFEFPVPNRVFPVGVQNVNQDDVYVQETDQQGNVINKWVKVPALAGENIIYNSIQNSQRNIFDVLSGASDTVSIRFADGNFGNVPTGLFRTWVRVSANESLIIRPDSAQGLQITIPYVGSDNQQYVLRVTFNLEQTIGNAASSETNEQIRIRAPEVFSTQSRMVNGSDYNVLPLIYGNQIAKIQAINRTYSGQSRYIDLNDPTGFHRDLVVFGEDGALYRDNENVLREVIKDASNNSSINNVVKESIQSVLRNKNVSNFFYDEYISQFENTIRVNKQNAADTGYSLLDLSNPYQTPLFWRTSPATSKNDTGYFTNSKTTNEAQTLVNNFNSSNPPAPNNNTYQAWGFITTDSVITMAKTSFYNGEWVPDVSTINSVPVKSIVQQGVPINTNISNTYANIGPVELSSVEPNYYQATKVYPKFRSALNTTELAEIDSRIDEGVSFWMYYDLLNDKWGTSTATNTGTSEIQNNFVYPEPYLDPTTNIKSIYSTWINSPSSGMLYVDIAKTDQYGSTSYDISARGRVYVFESLRDARFYWKPNEIVIDNSSGLALQDTIEIMPFVNTNSSVDNNDPVITNPALAFTKSALDFTISGTFTQEDGYVDTSKVKVSLVDNDSNGISDDPAGFDKLVSLTDRVVFEYYSNEVTGYQSTRPWVSAWATSLQEYTGNLYVYFPVNPNVPTELYGSPYISTMLVNNETNPEATDGAIIVYLDAADLIFINNFAQLDYNEVTPINSIANQITAFFNGPDSANFSFYQSLQNSQTLINKSDILTTYFFNKSFLLGSSMPGYGQYKALSLSSTSDVVNYPAGKIAYSEIDKYHYDRNGKSFTQNLSIAQNDKKPLYFKWKHYSPVDQRVDPSPANIIDMIVITNSYYRDMTIWKNSNSTLATLPETPTTEALRIQFQDLNQYKMVSDSIVWNSGEFKLLFGTQASPELQATFKVVKSPAATISDNEIKTRVVQAIDIYFDIRNWDFGEKFFYTELAAFIHQQLSKLISSVVIVPNNASSQFGNLFEIVASPNQIFMSTATVNNVQIVSNFTEQNLRV